MKKNHLNFTEKAIGNLPLPASGSQTYYDSGSKDGLILIVTYGGTKTYYFYMFFQGRPVRVKIGRFSDIKLIHAREMAHSLREQATKGQDPSKKRKEELKDITFKQFYETVYRPEWSVVHKKTRSIDNDDSIFKYHLLDFHNKRMLNIHTDEIERLHNRTKVELTPYTANRVLSLIKHMYVIAVKYGYVGRDANPAEFIKKFPEKSRDRFLHSDEMARFMTALESETNQVFKNYVLLSLFSGQRRSNILALRWSDIDFKNGFIRIDETKNGEPMQVPMTTQLKELLQEIKSTSDSDWVLPSNKSASGHLEDPKRPWQEFLKRADIQNLRLHDLRRTQGSYQAMSGSSLHMIGRSLGHKSTSATQVYARLSAEPIRESMQKATDKMLNFD